MAKCPIHGKEIIANCFQCGEPLCERCVMKKIKGRHYCFKCAIEGSLVDFEKEEKKIEKLKSDRERYLKSKKKSVFRLRLAIIILSILAVIECAFYVPLYFERRNYFDDNYRQYINSNVDLIDVALRNYGRLNNGKYPEKLPELVPRFLPEFKLPFLLSKEINYKTDKELGYLLTWSGRLGGVPAKIVISKTGRIIDTLSRLEGKSEDG
jgi:hypothetical protein